MGRNKKTKLSTSRALTPLIGLSRSIIAMYPPISSAFHWLSSLNWAKANSSARCVWGNAIKDYGLLSRAQTSFASDRIVCKHRRYARTKATMRSNFANITLFEPGSVSANVNVYLQQKWQKDFLISRVPVSCRSPPLISIVENQMTD